MRGLLPAACAALAVAVLIPGAVLADRSGVVPVAGEGHFAQSPLGSPDQPDPKKPQNPINTISELFAALSACWIPPVLDQSRPGMEITVMMSFTRVGAVLGKPRITHESRGASDDERLAYRIAVADMLKRCTPLPFTDGLGNALAGRPLTMRFTDNRKLKQAGYVHE